MIAALLLLGGLALAAPEGWSQSGHLDLSVGVDGNPLRLPRSRAPSKAATTGFGIADEVRWKRENLIARLSVSGKADMVPAVWLAGDDEIRLEPSVRLAGGGALRPWIELAGLFLASDNSLLTGSERFDDQGTRQGERRERAHLEFGLKPRGFGRTTFAIAWQRRDFEEMEGATSLDRSQWEASSAWSGPSWGPFSLDAVVDFEDRTYRVWPARYVWGDVAPGVAKRLTTVGAEAGGTLDPTARLRLRAKGRIAFREDRAWGYFDETMPSVSASVRWKPDSLWTFQARIQEAWEAFDNYRDGYDPSGDLKRSRSDFGGLELGRRFGSREFSLCAERRAESNTNARYAWTSWSAAIGLRQSF